MVCSTHRSFSLPKDPLPRYIHSCIPGLLPGDPCEIRCRLGKQWVVALSEGPGEDFLDFCCGSKVAWVFWVGGGWWKPKTRGER